MGQVLELHSPAASTAPPLIATPAPVERPDQPGSAPAIDDNPWMSDLWLNTWWEVYSVQRPLRAVSLSHRQPVSWPLYQETRRHLRHWALVGSEYCRHSLPHGASIPNLAAQIAARRDWDTLTFAGLPLAQAEQWRDCLHAGSIAAWVGTPRQQRFLPLDRPWSEVEAEIRPGMRRDLNRRRRALEKLGALRLRVQTQADGLDELFEACVVVEASGWKGRQGTALAACPEARRFYHTLARRAADAGALHLSLLYSGETLIAFALGLVHQRVYAGAKIAYLDSWRRHGPGTVLIYSLLQHLHLEGMAELDFSGGDDRYKAEWTSHTRTLADLQACNRTARGRVATLIARSRTAVGARLRPRTG